MERTADSIVCFPFVLGKNKRRARQMLLVIDFEIDSGGHLTLYGTTGVAQIPLGGALGGGRRTRHSFLYFHKEINKD